MIRLTRDQARQIDHLAQEKLKIPGVVLMENAAIASADQAQAMMRGDCVGHVLILCGGGNNGGDGLAIARHLHVRGADVTIGLTTDPAKYRGEAKVNWDIVSAMGLHTEEADPRKIAGFRSVLIIDAIFGTGLTKEPRPPFDQIVQAVERLRCPVLAIDIPSGLDCDTGEPLGACMRAERTITFVADKVGFSHPAAQRYTGQVVVAQIGVPRELIDEVVQQMV